MVLYGQQINSYVDIHDGIEHLSYSFTSFI